MEEHNETPAAAPETSSENVSEETTSAGNGGAARRPVTPERVADVAIGLGVLAAEAIDKAARSLDGTVRSAIADTPAFLEQIEEKGRPVREKLRDSLRGVAPSVSDAFTAAADKTKPSPATDDIETLENRVRELEQQVGTSPNDDTPAAPADASPFSMLEIDDTPSVASDPTDPSAANTSETNAADTGGDTPRSRSRRKSETSESAPESMPETTIETEAPVEDGTGSGGADGV